MAFDTWVPQVVICCCLMLALQLARAKGMLRMPSLNFSLPFLSVQFRRRAPAPPPPVRSKPPPPHVTLSAAKATDLFLEHLASEWCERFIGAVQVDEAWESFAKARGIYLMNASLIRGEMTGRGLCLGRRSLRAPELLHIGRATGYERCVIYKRPTVAELKALSERGSTLAPYPGPVEDGVLAGHERTRPMAAHGTAMAQAKKRITKRKLTPSQRVSPPAYEAYLMEAA